MSVVQILGAHLFVVTSKVLHRQWLTLQCGMPNTPDNEIRGILDVIKGLTGEYRAQGETMELTPQQSRWGDFQARDKDGYLLYLEDFDNEGRMVPYDNKHTEDEMIGIFQALQQQPHYRPIKRTQDSMDFEIEVMRRYPQFFGGK